MSKDEEYAGLVQRHLEQRFPLVCSCGVRFSCHGDFLERVTPIGQPVSLDIGDDAGGAALDDDPIGIIAYANCNACGTTLAMATLDMPARVRREMLAWVQSEARSRGITRGELMESVRRRIQAISLAAWAAQKDESGRPGPPSGPPDS